MRRLFKYIFLFLIIFGISYKVDAKTLKDLKNELAALEKKQRDNNNKKSLTQNQISQVNTRIGNISKEIEKSQQEIVSLEEEVKELEDKKVAKDAQIKSVFSFMQIANSENAYIEYIFGAKDIEDLVLRSAVSEQLVNYNDDLINEYNDTIVKCNSKKDDLADAIVKLDSEQENLEVELVTLGDQLSSVMDVGVDIASEIAAQKKSINYYEKTLGCKDNQDINTCGTIPYSGKMIRPINSGAITSYFGYRKDPITGKNNSFHSGTDMAGDSKVYAVAPGRVAGIYWKTKCGGTMLFVNHNINGTNYTSGYYHLYQVKVSVGDYVDQNTQIAVTGGTRGLTPWDGCSTGRHLHLSIAKGLFFKEYSSYSKFTSKLINPTSMINFPHNGTKGYYWSNRTTIYK